MRPDFHDARVSVIIPNRDTLETLPAAILSVLGQGISELDLIVIDDGSTDGSREWLAEFALTCPVLRVLHTEGVGPSSARNEGISISCAPIIAFLDSDDVWERGKLRMQLAFMERNPEFGFTFTDYRHVGPDGEDRGTCFGYWNSAFARKPPTHFFEVENAESALLATNLVGTSTVAIRKTLLQNANGFATRMWQAEDWDLWLRIAGMTRVAATSMVGTDYLMRPGSLSSRAEERIGAIAGVMARYHDRHEPEFRQALRHVRGRLLRARAEMNRAQGAFAAAALAEIRAMLLQPDRRKARAALGDLARLVRFAGQQA